MGGGRCFFYYKCSNRCIRKHIRFRAVKVLYNYGHENEASNGVNGVLLRNSLI